MSITEEQVSDAVSEWVEIYSTYDGDINFHNHDTLYITIALRIHNWNIPDCSIELLEYLKEIVGVDQDDEKYTISIKDDPTSCWYVEKNQWSRWSQQEQ